MKVAIITLLLLSFAPTKGRVSKQECQEQAGIYVYGVCMNQWKAYKTVVERWPNYGGINGIRKLQ